ncbi:DUF7282 domain-containing protein [Haloarchaeobius sp. DFWS5]|uniref:DUF7282 domain-containing protein n=1 Tax=Haloarchaeobius sp. DFWS5 TaxID=3446114 RepID=UPI003EB7587B
MRGPLSLALAVCVVAASLAVPVAAHGNHLSADAQLSSDGTLVVESLFTMNGGHIVVHQKTGSGVGQPLGSAQVSQGFHRNVQVAIDDRFWQAHSGNQTYWVVLHRDDGDGKFEPGTDTPIQGLTGGYAGQTIEVGKSDDGAVRVATSGFNDQDVDSSAVTVRQVATDRPSYLVVRAVGDDGSASTVVGTKTVDPGTYDNMTVSLSSSFFSDIDTGNRTTLEAGLYERSGDGEFSTPSDEPVRVGDSTVSSRFRIEKVENAQATTEPLINTPEPTTGTDSGVTTGSASSSVPTDGENDSTGPSPGFSVLVTVAAVVSLLLVARRRLD